MRRAALLLPVLLLSVLSVAAESPFAALSVVPKGRQVLDITTGVTVLPDGGSVIDQQTGVTLEAEHIRYLDGAFIEAAGVNVKGAFGDLFADSLLIDIPGAQLSASGGLSLIRAEVELSAAQMWFFAGDNVVVFEGSVASTAPLFAADKALLDAATGDVLLIGRYSFDGGFIKLTSPAEGGRLELRLKVDGDSFTYDAATEISQELLERFKTHL